MRTNASGTDWFARPAVEVLDDDTTVMVYYGGTGHADNVGALHIKFSDDYGATWTAEDTNLSGGAVTGFPMNPPAELIDAGQDSNEPWLYIAPNGDLLVHMWAVQWSTSNWGGSFQSRSTDGGLTWSTPIATPITGFADNDLVFTTDDHFVYDGVIYAACSQKNTPTFNSSLMKSEDNGASWQFVANVSSLTSEIGIEYVGNSTIRAVLRDANNVATWRSISTDMGQTWSTKEDITAMVPPSGRHRLWTDKHLRGEANWWDDDRMVMCCYVYFGTSRRNALFFSKDRGVTWSLPLYAESDYADAGYGDVFYNALTGGYTFMCYRGTNSKADLVQYNFTVEWGT